MLKATLAAIALAILVLSACGGDSGPRVRLVLEPLDGVQVTDLDLALDGAVRVIERRLDKFDIGSSNVERSGDNSIEVLVRLADAEQAERVIGRTGLLQFCVPLLDDGGDVGVLTEGVVRYKPQTCDPVRDDSGNIVIDPGEDRDGNVIPPGEIWFATWTRTEQSAQTNDIVWISAAAEVDGVELLLDSQYLKPNSFVAITANPALGGQPTLIFEFGGGGEEALELITERLSERTYPLAVFLDGEPLPDSNGLILAPRVQAPLTGGLGTISGLSLETAEELSTLLNSGAYPVPVEVVDVSAVLD